MSKKTEALEKALDALEASLSAGTEEEDFAALDLMLDARKTIKSALADSALERMAKNERELGIDYMRPAEIPQSITCPFCESQHVPGWLHDYNMDRMKKPAQQTCNCRWEGETQVQQCTLHEAHVDAIHELAERAKAAEAKLKAQPLTDEEIAEIAAQGHQRWIEFARAIEAAHGIKEDA